MDSREYSLPEALTPFDAMETRRLMRYRAKTQELRSSSFFAEPQVIHPDFSAPVTYEITNASREVVNAVVAPLRLLYAQRDSVSFGRIRALFGAHAKRDTADGLFVLRLLRFYKRAIGEVMTFDPDMGIFNVDELGVV